MRAIIAALLVAGLAAPAHAQSLNLHVGRVLRDPPSPRYVGRVLSDPPIARAERPASAATPGRGRNIAWTLGGIGIGFGAGVFIGFAKYDDARYAETKITQTALGCAAVGGVLGYFLSRPRE